MEITLDRAVSGFRLYNEAKGLSKRTLAWYGSNLAYFSKWVTSILGHEPMISEIIPDHVRSFIMNRRNSEQCYAGHPFTPIQEKKLSANSVKGYYTTLHSFFNWAIREEILLSSPMRNVSRPKVPKFIPDPFNQEEIQKMLTAAKALADTSSLRAVAIVLFLLDTGVRLNELITLKLEEVDLDLGRAKVFGKGSKERHVFFGRSTKRALWRYISMARPEPAAGSATLFLNNNGYPLAQRHVAHILERLSKDSGVQKLHPHRFRRTAAIQFIRNGGNILALQKLLGHETLDMVRHYVDLASEDVAEAHKLASPVDRWKL